jgi:hypothetical protein
MIHQDTAVERGEGPKKTGHAAEEVRAKDCQASRVSGVYAVALAQGSKESLNGL